MLIYIKKLINEFLSKLNLKIIYYHRNTVLGLNFYRDLKLTIGKAHPVCLDVGANAGQTIDLLQKVFSRPTIYAFEPSSKTFRFLQSKDFGNQVFMYNFALGKECKKDNFINYKNSALSSFLPLDTHEENRFRDTEVESKETVIIDTVDGFLQRNRIRNVDLLKIDTQGFDLEVLLGAQEALQSGVIRNVLIELNFIRMYKGQGSVTEIINLLVKYDIVLVDFYEKNRLNNRLSWCTALFTTK